MNAPMTYAAPSAYNISAERFAQIAAGIPLTQEEITAMLSGSAAPEPTPVVQSVAPMQSLAPVGSFVTTAGVAAAVTSAAAAPQEAVPSAAASKKKSAKKKKSLKSKKG